MAGLVLFSALEPPGDAKLVSPPLGLVAAPNPPPKLENPEPIAPKPEGAALAKGEGPAAAAKPVLGLSDSFVSGSSFLKTDEFEPPREPKGDFSDPEKAAKLDEAKAELEVTWDFFESSASWVAGFEDPNAPKGDTAEVFANPLGTGTCKARLLVSALPCLSPQWVCATHFFLVLGIIPVSLFLRLPFRSSFLCRRFVFGSLFVSLFISSGLRLV